MDNPLLAISPLDGRYSGKVDYLSQYFSEAALMRYRCLVEIEWLIYLFNEVKLKNTRVLKPTELRILRTIYEQFAKNPLLYHIRRSLKAALRKSVFR